MPLPFGESVMAAVFMMIVVFIVLIILFILIRVFTGIIAAMTKNAKPVAESGKEGG